MKHLFKTLTLLLFIAMIGNVQTASGACTASFTKSVSGLTVTFNNTSTTTSGFPLMMQYQWNFGDATTSTLKNPVKTYATPGVKIVTLMINDSFGCTKTITDTVFVTTPSTCAANFTKTISGLNVTFNNTSSSSSGAGNLMYNWTFSDATTSTLKNPVKAFTSGGVKTATLTIFDTITLCTSTKTDTFVLASAPTCAANFTKTISGLNVTFNNTSSSSSGAGNLIYNWTFSDATTSTFKNPVKAFTSGGVKTATLTIFDTITLCTSTKTDTFVLASAPTCAANFTRTISGLTVTFNNTSTSSNGPSAVNYSWLFSDGGTSAQKNPVKTFATAGVKTAKLTIFDSVTLCSSSKTDTFVLATASTCAANFTKTISGLNVTFNNTSSSSSGAGNLMYNWTFSDATTSTLKNPVKAFTSGGVKTATLTIFDTITLCTSTKTDTFVLASAATCTANFTRTISGLTVTFNNTSTSSNGPSAVNYSWLFSDGGTSAQKNPVKTFTTAGVKTAKLTIFDSVTLCSSSKTDTFVLIAPTNLCNASFTKSISGLSVSFTNTSTNTNGSAVGLSYLWNFSDGTTSVLKNPIKTFASAGTKTARLTINDSIQGCFKTIIDTFILSPPPVLCRAQFTLAIDTNMPFNFFILNTSIVRPGTTYFWSFGDGGTSMLLNPTHTYANFGTYNICLTITDSICTSTFCDTVGMDSTGMLLKTGGFGFKVLDYTTQSTANSVSNIENIFNQIKLFPNPVDNELHVQIPSDQATALTIKLLDITGRKITEKTMRCEVGNNNEIIEMHDLKPSLYLIEVSTNQYRKTFKVLKN